MSMELSIDKIFPSGEIFIFWLNMYFRRVVEGCERSHQVEYTLNPPQTLFFVNNKTEFYIFITDDWETAFPCTGLHGGGNDAH